MCAVRGELTPQWHEEGNPSTWGPAQVNKTAGNRLELGQKSPHTEGKAQGKGQQWQFQARALRLCQKTLKPFPSSLNWNLSSQSQLKSVPEIASALPQTPGSSWAATRLQGCSGVHHTQKWERHFVQKLKEAAELKSPLAVAKYCFENVFGIHCLEVK